MTSWYFKHKNDPGFLERRGRQHRRWARLNRERLLAYSAKYRRRSKQAVYELLGSKCACCGESIEEFLAVDHIASDGKKDRKRWGTGQRFYLHILRCRHPKRRYRILCMNCNHAMGRHGSNGVCPHAKLARSL